MELELKLQKKQFILHESIKVEVVVRNTGAAAVEVPGLADNRNTSLTYTLSGASFEKPITFDYAGLQPMRAAGPVSMETVEPKSEISEPITIEHYWKAWKPGKHTLSSAFEGVQAKPVEFEIVPAEVQSAEVLVDAGAQPSGFMRALFLANGRLYQAFFPEIDPDVELTPEGNIVDAGAADPQAKHVMGTWTPFDRSSVLFARFGWEGPDKIGVQETKASVVLETHGKRFRPAIMNQAGEVSLLTTQGKAATLSNIPRAGSATSKWTSTLPFEPVSGRFATSAKGDLIAAFLSQSASGLDAVLLDGTGKIAATLRCEDAVFPPGSSEPALSIDAAGSIRLAMVASSPDDPKKMMLVEWSRLADAAEFKVRKGPAFSAPVNAKASGAIHGVTGVNPRCDWVVVLEDGKLITNRQPEHPREVEGAPAIPLQLMPRPQMTYLLMLHPNEVVYMAPLF